jgi:hypothetical protein
MNQEVKDKWLSALRSDKYKQTTGLLNHNDEGFCCLGVLCEIAVEDGVIEKVGNGSPDHIEPRPSEVIGYADQYPNGARYTQYDILPNKVKEWAGLDSQNPYVTYSHDPDDPHAVDNWPISDLNDDFKLNFKKIADVIEEQL